MKLLLDCNEERFNAAMTKPVDIGQLLTPLTNRSWFGGGFAVDNGAFATFDASSFRRLLDRLEPHRDHCHWVAAPDVVGSARRTLEAFRYWYSDEQLSLWPCALVAQDGIEDLDIPWGLIRAVFLGGSTEFKMSQHAVAVIKCAQLHGKWVHVGRVNTSGRFLHFAKLGVDSIDGTGISRYEWMLDEIVSASRGENFMPLYPADALKEKP